MNSHVKIMICKTTLNFSVEGRVYPHITQIAATELKRSQIQHVFDAYCSHRKETSAVTGIPIVEGVIKCNGEIV